jgi:restriction system protein
MYFIEISHTGLGKNRRIRGNDYSVLEQLATAQIAIWEEMWKKKLEKEERAKNRQSKTEEARERSNQALEATKAIENILAHTLVVDDAIDWEALKDKSEFPKPKPQPPQPLALPLPPRETDPRYQPEIGLLDNIFSSRKRKRIDNAKILFKNECDKWEELKKDINRKNTELEEQYQNDLKQWEIEKQDFLNRQKEKHAAIEKRKKQYLDKSPDAIKEYCELVLSNSEYPDYFPQEFDLDYNSETKILIVDYSLPSVDDIPRLKEVKYVKSKDELVEVFLAESVVSKLYDNLFYQVALRTIHELYESDVVNALASIVFNGWVESVDKATGKKVNACILSVQASLAEFSSISLENVDPKACFRSLKGVGSSKLHSLTPIAPILNISREDKRFVSSYEVADSLDESINIAAMDWWDFENLVREIFEKEFAQGGGEVKITQASRDGGVDAIAFDPDPIRGGKIAIQAKRYTNTVGVAAVRDLYGTVINEGATKGILITTADYGPDAYEFAKGKPLTLLNGSNLLHLLEKHGHKAKIDLKAARQELADKEKQSKSEE